MKDIILRLIRLVDDEPALGIMALVVAFWCVVAVAAILTGAK